MEDVLEQLTLDKRVSNLKDCVGELQRVQELLQLWHALCVLGHQAVPRVGRPVARREPQAVREGRVQAAEARREDGAQARVLADVRGDRLALARQGHAEEQRVAGLLADAAVAVDERYQQREEDEAGRVLFRRDAATNQSR